MDKNIISLKSKLLTALILMLAWWLIDSCVDFFLFRFPGSLLDQILWPQPNQIALRLLVSAGIILAIFIIKTNTTLGQKKFPKKIEQAAIQHCFDIAADIMIILTTEGKVYRINKKGCETLGYNEDEIIGKDWFDNFIPKNIRDNVRVVFQQIILGNIKAYESHENTVLTKSQAERLIVWHNDYLKDHSGKIIAAVSSGEDITEYRLTEDILHSYIKDWHATFDGIKDAIFRTDTQGNILQCNKSLVDFVGKSAQEIIGKRCYDVIHGESNFVETCPLKKALLSRHREISTLVKADKWFNVIVDPLFDSHGNITAAIQIISDITEQKKSEQALGKAYGDLKDMQTQLIQKAKLAAVGQLARGVAHEINNPLAVVLNSAQLIIMATEHADNVNKEGLQEAIHFIEESVRRCSSIIKALLDFARPSTGQYFPCNINEMIEKIIVLIEYDLRVSNIIIERQLQKDLPMISGNFQLLQQALFNMFINSRWAIDKKQEKGGGKIVIITQYDENSKNVVVSISDTGIGIASENLERIFEAFFTTKDPNEGTGIGLTLTYKIIKDHNGDIDVTSELGKGTTFKIVFPALAG